MKRIDWFMAILLVISGLTCLTISGTAKFGPDSIDSYLITLLHLCLWMGVPVLVAGIVYLIIIRKKRKETDK